VFFRDSTSEQADTLGLGGWIRNTQRGTVEGEVIGDPAKAQVMSVPLSFFHFLRLLFVFLTDIDCPTSISNFFWQERVAGEEGEPGVKDRQGSVFGV